GLPYNDSLGFLGTSPPLYGYRCGGTTSSASYGPGSYYGLYGSAPTAPSVLGGGRYGGLAQGGIAVGGGGGGSGVFRTSAGGIVASGYGSGLGSGGSYGGYNGGFGAEEIAVHQTVECYDTSAGRWRPCAGLQHGGRAGLALCAA
ncbi:hypothetical protein Agub_g1491, partial [Astrephomene gubernaculifera]